MGFRKQLVGGLAVQIGLVLVVCVVSAITLYRVTRAASRDTLQTLDDVRNIHQIHTRIEQLVANARGFLISGDQAYLDRVGVLRRELDANLETLDRDGETTAELAGVVRQLREYSAAIDGAVRARERVSDLTALELLYERRLSPLRELLEDAFERFERAKSDRLEDRMQEHEGISLTAVLAVVLASLIAIGLSVGVGIIVVRRISLQYREVQAAKDAASEAAAHRKELLDIVSHDLRTPLGTIALGLEALREDHADLHHVRILEHAARSMERLVNDLLDTARAETSGLDLELTSNDSQQLLTLAVELFAARAERSGVELRIDHPTHATVVADRDRVLQILANLIGNALKVTPRGGTISLTADPTPDGIRFSVRDSGPGLESENIPNLFEAYRQGKAGAWRRGSLGLGLYISKTLTQAHGGKIGVDSHDHDGSTFWFELPRDPRPHV